MGDIQILKPRTSLKLTLTLCLVLGVSGIAYEAQAQQRSNAPLPPPLIMKDDPVEAVKNATEGMVIDLTNPPAPALPEAVSNPVPTNALEVINIDPVATKAPSDAELRKIAENQLRVPQPNAKPADLPVGTNKAVYGSIERLAITPDNITSNYFDGTSTLVGKKIISLQGDLNTLQNDVRTLAVELDTLEQQNQRLAAEYYASVATINTQLQAGTTPGNPRLLTRIQNAQENLEALSANANGLNDLAIRIANNASVASFLMDSTRSAYTLTGAVEEEHVELAKVEDNVNNTLVVIERLLNNVNDDITRTGAYLGSERNNLRALSLAVANGDLYSRSLANRPFSSAQRFSASTVSAPTASGLTPEFPQAQSASPAPLSGPRPLIKIRFDNQDVEYEQALFNAVNEAMELYPNGRFDLVAVNPKRGNAAQVAIESTRARRNAERVLRTLTQMGLDSERVDLSYSDNENASVNEVHLYVR